MNAFREAVTAYAKSPELSYMDELSALGVDPDDYQALVGHTRATCEVDDALFRGFKLGIMYEQNRTRS